MLPSGNGQWRSAACCTAGNCACTGAGCRRHRRRHGQPTALPLMALLPSASAQISNQARSQQFEGEGGQSCLRRANKGPAGPRGVCDRRLVQPQGEGANRGCRALDF